jgi:transcriptional regulator
MYQPSHFKQTDPDAWQAVLREHPFATLVSQGAGGLTADHLPFEFDAGQGSHGTLLAHVARANPLWQQADGAEVLAIFQGPQAYITPSWYEAKAETGKVVPTWNYAVVHLHGRLRAVDDAVWLRGFVERLTRRHEASRAQPWAVGDAPADYIEQMLKAIVGVRIEVERVEAKWKVSQNRGETDRRRVAEGLAAEPGDNAAGMSRLVAARSA